MISQESRKGAGMIRRQHSNLSANDDEKAVIASSTEYAICKSALNLSGKRITKVQPTRNPANSPLPSSSLTPNSQRDAVLGNVGVSEVLGSDQGPTYREQSAAAAPRNTATKIVARRSKFTPALFRGVNPRCHFCRIRDRRANHLLCARSPKCKINFCFPCLKKQFGLDPNGSKFAYWTCFVCTKDCTCEPCGLKYRQKYKKTPSRKKRKSARRKAAKNDLKPYKVDLSSKCKAKNKERGNKRKKSDKDSAYIPSVSILKACDIYKGTNNINNSKIEPAEKNKDINCYINEDKKHEELPKGTPLSSMNFELPPFPTPSFNNLERDYMVHELLRPKLPFFNNHQYPIHSVTSFLHTVQSQPPMHQRSFHFTHCPAAVLERESVSVCSTSIFRCPLASQSCLYNRMSQRPEIPNITNRSYWNCYEPQ
eukprot:TRINITY_DN2125_c0_g1_i9.p1 TRINITY_DN2125_c0_g1~~TRINITY_DN2125_c0_g1_i9.p1  ORF type:complete len:425 (-),score=-6.42 TRINITY_DN2125_c0_g1_i9:63-1337(-)